MALAPLLLTPLCVQTTFSRKEIKAQSIFCYTLFYFFEF